MGTRIDDAVNKVTLVATDKIPLGDGSFSPKFYEVSQIAEYAVSLVSAAITSVNQKVSVLDAARTSIGQAVSVNTAAIASVNNQVSVLDAARTSTGQAVSVLSAARTSVGQDVSVLYDVRTSINQVVSVLSDARTSVGQAVSVLNAAGYVSGNVVSNTVSAAKIFSIIVVSTGRQLGLADQNAYLRSEGTTAISLAIPTCASVAFPIGCQILFRMGGTGKFSVSTPVGVSVQVPSSCSMEGRGQGSSFALIKYTSDTWDITGDLSVK